MYKSIIYDKLIVYMVVVGLTDGVQSLFNHDLDYTPIFILKLNIFYSQWEVWEISVYK